MADAGSARRREGEEKEEEDDVVCLDPSFFVDRSYEMTTFTFGSQVLNVLCLRAASRKQSSIPCLFDTVERLLRLQAGECRFTLAYVSRTKVMDALLKEAEKHGMHIEEVDGTRTTISNLEGVIFDITLK